MKTNLSKKKFSIHRKISAHQQLQQIENVQLTSDNILSKLLNPINIQKKQDSQYRKYKPKFIKPDYQTVINQNIKIKQLLNIQKQNTIQLKFKMTEFQRKIKFLQNIQQKWQQKVQQNNNNTIPSDLYTDILKKKIQQMTQLYLASQQQIKQLKKLPHISIFDQQNTQMQQLKRQTIRLRSVIASMQQFNEDNLQNRFVKLMKQQNQKLKSTVRLLQNDKNLLKSRQVIQKRQINDAKKQVQDLKRKLIIKQAQIQKINNQSKNILLKRAFQLKANQQNRQNQQIVRLKSQLSQKKQEISKLEDQRDHYYTQNQKFKLNQVVIQSKQATQERQKQQLRNQINRYRRTIQDLKTQLQRQKQKIINLQNQFKKNRKQIRKPQNLKKSKQTVKSIKYQDLQLGLLHINFCLNINKSLKSIQELFQKQDQQITCNKIIDILTENPVSLQKYQALKMARYIVQDSESKNVVYNPLAKTNKIQCITIIKAALAKYLQCKSIANEDNWRCLLSRSKKFLSQLEKMRGQYITKQNFINILCLHTNQTIGDYVNIVFINSFDHDSSYNEAFLNIDQILQVLNNILNNR